MTQHFTVYRVLKGGGFQWIATTVFREDAQRILDGWAQGYIVDSTGAMIKKKGDWE